MWNLLTNNSFFETKSTLSPSSRFVTFVILRKVQNYKNKILGQRTVTSRPEYKCSLVNVICSGKYWSSSSSSLHTISRFPLSPSFTVPMNHWNSLRRKNHMWQHAVHQRKKQQLLFTPVIIWITSYFCYFRFFIDSPKKANKKNSGGFTSLIENKNKKVV